MKPRRSLQHKLTSGALALCTLAAGSSAVLAAGDPRDDLSPWGIAPGAEGLKEHVEFNPLLEQAGVRWLRCFTMWNGLEKEQGVWTWEKSDALQKSIRDHKMHAVGYLGFLAKWASVNGDVRELPMKDITYWRDYVTQVVTRYKGDIMYWEVWNEFNGGFAKSKDKPKDYADLTVTAYDAAKKVDPTSKVGISCANFDLNFFDRTIKAGAANHFDFVCVHPYENLGAAMNGGEPGFLAMVGNIRKMLADNKQRTDMPLWITEIGRVTDGSPEADAIQAEALVKTYILSIAQGFDRIFWFEAMGPAIYGKKKNETHGIIQSNMTPRPAFNAMKMMIGLLGEEPKYSGWLDLSEGGYGFVFQGPKDNVLVAWSPLQAEKTVKFEGDVKVVDLLGAAKPLAAGTPFALPKVPVFITGLPPALFNEAQANKAKPFPWGGDYAKAKTVRCQLGADILDEGIYCMKPGNLEVGMAPLGEVSWRILDTAARPNLNCNFRVNPSFLLSQPHRLEITVVARRGGPKAPPAVKLTYESDSGYKTAKPAWTLPNDDQWHENTWIVDNANFVGQWAYNFGFTLSGPGKLQVKEVRVTKVSE